ncbi:MAG TPA: response regulator [Candidatus Hydrogenedentes bacterium]|nr:response regulator [Candidatus Hydrogenedentota bacterium]
MAKIADHRTPPRYANQSVNGMKNPVSDMPRLPISPKTWYNAASYSWFGQPGAQSMTGRNMHSILVVDDEPNIRSAIAQWLSIRGFDVDTAEDGQTAVDMCRARHYDLVTMDLVMPRLSGNEAIRAIRKISPGTVILIVSGLPETEETPSWTRDMKVLAKPLRLLELEDEVRALLRTCA